MIENGIDWSPGSLPTEEKVPPIIQSINQANAKGPNITQTSLLPKELRTLIFLLAALLKVDDQELAEESSPVESHLDGGRPPVVQQRHIPTSSPDHADYFGSGNCMSQGSAV